MIDLGSKVFSKKIKSWRSVSSETMEKYGAMVRESEGVEYAIEYPYGGGAFKVRSLASKDFLSEGAMSDKSLFGMDRFIPGSKPAIVITEGELDAMSAHETVGKYAVCVSVRSSTTARKDCERAYKYINSFDKIYLNLDNDTPGIGAATQIATLFDVNKVYSVDLGSIENCKDANDCLTQGRTADYIKCWFNARKFLPKGIVSSYADIEQALRRRGQDALVDYPFPTLQGMTYGIRPGEMVLFTAQEKVGKTSVFRALEHHVLKTTDHNIGIIHLEESEKRSIQGLLSYEFKEPVHLPDSSISVEDQLSKYKELTRGEDGRVCLYTHFGSDDPNTILDMIRYMVVVCKCKIVFLDHITMLVTGFEGDDERKKLDYLSTRLAMLAHELDFALILVSHVNDDNKTRGSRNISKVADVIIHLSRNIEATGYDERNTIEVMLKGNRFYSASGPAGYLKYDQHTDTIKELTVENAGEKYGAVYQTEVQNPF